MNGCRNGVQTTITKFYLIKYDRKIKNYSKSIKNKKQYNLFKIHEYLKKILFYWILAQVFDKIIFFLATLTLLMFTHAMPLLGFIIIHNKSYENTRIIIDVIDSK